MPFPRFRLANAARLGMVVVLAAAGAAESAGSHRLSVGATVVHGGNCSFTAPGPAALSFKADSKSSVDISYRCNGGAASTVSWAALSANTGNTRPAVTVTNTVTTVDLQRTHSHGDTVVLTITP